VQPINAGDTFRIENSQLHECGTAIAADHNLHLMISNNFLGGQPIALGVDSSQIAPVAVPEVRTYPSGFDGVTGKDTVIRNTNYFQVVGNQMYPDAWTMLHVADSNYGDVTGNTLESYYVGPLIVQRSKYLLFNSNVIGVPGNPVANVTFTHANDDVVSRDVLFGLIHIEDSPTMVMIGNLNYKSFCHYERYS
jgi:hypothetical protein